MTTPQPSTSRLRALPEPALTAADRAPGALGLRAAASTAISLSEGGRKRPALSAGGPCAASTASFSVGSRPQVVLGALDASVAEPQGDLADVAGRGERVHGTAVAQNVRRDAASAASDGALHAAASTCPANRCAKPSRVIGPPSRLRNSSGPWPVGRAASQARNAACVSRHRGSTRSRRPLPRPARSRANGRGSPRAAATATRTRASPRHRRDAAWRDRAGRPTVRGSGASSSAFISSRVR